MQLIDYFFCGGTWREGKIITMANGDGGGGGGVRCAAIK